MDFGLQTFTIRKIQKKNIELAYQKLYEMKITNLEIARIKFTKNNAYKIKQLIDKFRLTPVAIQVKPKEVFNKVDNIVEFCNIIGCKNVIISMLPFDCILGSEKNFYRFIDSLDEYFKIYQKYEITLGYHHHNWEYIKLSNGKTRMEELLSRTTQIRFVHDTYWTSRCGIDPVKQINEFGTRLLGVHLRDLTFFKKNLNVVPIDCAIGDGVIDFSRIILSLKDTNCQYMVIEQNTDNPYKEIKKSLDFLKKLNQ